MTDDRSKPLISENPYHSLDQRPDSSQRPIKITKVNEGEEDRDSLGSDSTITSRNPRIQRYLVAVEYIGTRFYGAQQQATCRTVVGVLEEAFCKFIGQSVSIFCSSRTDAGVHALSNVCHVDVERISKRKPGEVLPPHEPAVVKKAVNHFLQKNEGPESVSTFGKDRAWHVPEELDLPTMQKACKILVGHHNFSSFRAAGCQAKSPIRSLDELGVTEVVSTPYFPPVMAREPQNADDPSECSELNTGMPYISSASKQNTVEVSNGESSKVFGMRRRHRCFVVTARARSFLYHQVRLIVGTLKAVGTGDLTVPDVERILKAKTVTAASPMAPACGLYLAHVKYDLS